MRTYRFTWRFIEKFLRTLDNLQFSCTTFSACLCLFTIIFYVSSAGAKPLISRNQSHANSHFSEKTQMDERFINKILEKYTDIVLMIVPKGLSFYQRIDEKRLEQVSCIFHGGIKSIPSILKIIEAGILKLENGPKPSLDLRILLKFTSINHDSYNIYMNDTSGLRPIQGYSGTFVFSASGAMPDQLRLWSANPEVSLIRNQHDKCR